MTQAIYVEMSLSWNFPAQASPSYEGSEPSRTKLGHINSRAETELTISIMCMSKKNHNFVPHYNMIYVQFYEFI